METKPKKRKLIKRLKSKFRLTILNESTFEETFSASLTPMNVIIIFGVLLVVFGAIIYGLVALTPLRAYVIPDFTDYEYRQAANVARYQVDSLLNEQKAQQHYLSDIRTILSGGVVEDDMKVPDSANIVSSSLEYQMTNEEGGLREKLAKEDRYELNSDAEQTQNSANPTFLFRPLDGTVSDKFNPKEEHFGLDIVAPKDAVVKAVLEGTVILASYTADGGNVLQIQHGQNLISVYKHNSVLFKKTGDFVKAGESIAVIGESGEESDGPHLHFELWQNGIPVDPLLFLVFDN